MFEYFVMLTTIYVARQTCRLSARVRLAPPSTLLTAFAWLSFCPLRDVSQKRDGTSQPPTECAGHLRALVPFVLERSHPSIETRRRMFCNPGSPGYPDRVLRVFMYFCNWTAAPTHHHVFRPVTCWSCVSCIVLTGVCPRHLSPVPLAFFSTDLLSSSRTWTRSSRRKSSCRGVEKSSFFKTLSRRYGRWTDFHLLRRRSYERNLISPVFSGVGGLVQMACVRLLKYSSSNLRCCPF